MKKRDLKTGQFIRTQPDKKCATCKTSFYHKQATVKYCSRSCYYEMKRVRKDRVVWTQKMRERVRLSKLGERNPSWRGGVTADRIKLRNTMQYKAWRKEVFERDNYTCNKCRVRGGNVNADHIIPWWADEAKRFDIKNGQTLCEKCHIEKTRLEMKENWINQFTSNRNTSI